MYDVITIGNPTIDTFLVVPPQSIQSEIKNGKQFFVISAGAKIPIQAIEKRLGGNAANVAVGVRRLGLRTAMICQIGTDREGYFVYNSFRKEKVSTRFIARKSGSAVNESTILHHENDKVIFAYHHNHHFHVKKLPRSRWVYLSSLGQDFSAHAPEILRALHKTPATRLAYNPGCLELSLHRSAVRSLIERSNIVILNKEEACSIARKKSASLRELARLVQKTQRGIVLITDGSRGSCADDGTTLFSAKIVPVKVLNSTGAGDAFSSGFLASYLMHGTIEDALYHASLNATEVIQTIGAQVGLIKKNELSRVEKKYPKSKFCIKKIMI